MADLVDSSTIWPYDDDGEPGAFFYSRYGHPTGTAAEARLGELEGGDALLYASGMGAATVVLLAFARPGSTVALARGAYFGTSVLVGELEAWGVRLVEYDQTGPPPPAEIVWVESPANPTLTEPSWEALAEPIAESGALLVCDATLSTPVYLRALERGAAVVIHSASKYLTGNHNALLGATVSADPALTARLREVRGRTGIAAAPHAAAALIDGLESLAARMTQITASATELSERLAAHPAVDAVRYPGYGGVISFEVADPRPLVNGTQMIVHATSLGGSRSTMEGRHRWEGDRIPRGLVRLSVGLESREDLWADLERALP